MLWLARCLQCALLKLLRKCVYNGFQIVISAIEWYFDIYYPSRKLIYTSWRINCLLSSVDMMMCNRVWITAIWSFRMNSEIRTLMCSVKTPENTPVHILTPIATHAYIFSFSVSFLYSLFYYSKKNDLSKYIHTNYM